MNNAEGGLKFTPVNKPTVEPDRRLKHGVEVARDTQNDGVGVLESNIPPIPEDANDIPEEEIQSEEEIKEAIGDYLRKRHITEFKNTLTTEDEKSEKIIRESSSKIDALVEHLYKDFGEDTENIIKHEQIAPLITKFLNLAEPKNIKKDVAKYKALAKSVKAIWLAAEKWQETKKKIINKQIEARRAAIEATKAEEEAGQLADSVNKAGEAGQIPKHVAEELEEKTVNAAGARGRSDGLTSLVDEENKRKARNGKAMKKNVAQKGRNGVDLKWEEQQDLKNNKEEVALPKSVVILIDKLLSIEKDTQESEAQYKLLRDERGSAVVRLFKKTSSEEKQWKQAWENDKAELIKTLEQLRAEAKTTGISENKLQAEIDLLRNQPKMTEAMAVRREKTTTAVFRGSEAVKGGLAPGMGTEPRMVRTAVEKGTTHAGDAARRFEEHIESRSKFAQAVAEGENSRMSQRNVGIEDAVKRSATGPELNFKPDLVEKYERAQAALDDYLKKNKRPLFFGRKAYDKEVEDLTTARDLAKKAVEDAEPKRKNKQSAGATGAIRDRVRVRGVGKIGERKYEITENPHSRFGGVLSTTEGGFSSTGKHWAGEKLDYTPEEIADLTTGGISFTPADLEPEKANKNRKKVSPLKKWALRAAAVFGLGAAFGGNGERALERPAEPVAVSDTIDTTNTETPTGNQLINETNATKAEAEEQMKAKIQEAQQSANDLLLRIKDYLKTIDTSTLENPVARIHAKKILSGEKLFKIHPRRNITGNPAKVAESAAREQCGTLLAEIPEEVIKGEGSQGIGLGNLKTEYNAFPDRARQQDNFNEAKDFAQQAKWALDKGDKKQAEKYLNRAEEKIKIALIYKPDTKSPTSLDNNITQLGNIIRRLRNQI